MYIAANDAVNQPTANNGMAVEDLMMVGIPKGPGGEQYSLFGGTPYMFAANATTDEINAALTYLEVMGKSPVLTDTMKAGLVEDAEYRVEYGIPVIKSFPAWAGEEYNAALDAVVAEYSNVDNRMFDDYFNTVASEGNLRMEEPKLTQEMYAELTKVLQAVVTDENADVQALMDTADSNLQAMLDEQVNN